MRRHEWRRLNEMGTMKIRQTAAIEAYPIILMFLLLMQAGCQETAKRTEQDNLLINEARLRWGAFFGSPFGMKFTNPEHLGTHHSKDGLGEINGMLYTCKGGFIDVGHVREAADRTAYCKETVYKNIMENKKEFSYHVVEPSEYTVKITYPSSWVNYSQKEKEEIANEVSIDMGQYLAHTSLIWHEIITWYGFATVAGFPDRISSFSWEDPYSDVMGTRLGVAALRNKEYKYDDAMTKLLNAELKELDVQPASVARRAAKRIAGQWYTGGFYFFVHMKEHNFDVGYDDGKISPVLVPNICADAIPKLYSVPRADAAERYGFKFEVEIEPKVEQKQKIYNAIELGKNSKIRPRADFGQIIDAIEQDNARMLASNVKHNRKIKNAGLFIGK